MEGEETTRHSITHVASTGTLAVWAPVLIAVVVAALIVVGVVVILRRRRRGEVSSRPTESQESVLQDFETQVRALLAQRGGRMSQIEIQRALGLPANLVARKLLEMENDGLVDRDWVTDDYTFGVESTTSA